MRLSLAPTALLLLAAQAESMPQIARIVPRIPVDPSLIKHHDYVSSKVAREAHPIVNHKIYHQRNVIPASSASIPTSSAIALAAASPQAQAPSSSGNDWKTQTSAACLKSLSALNGQASNPSGMAACYNVQSLNASTGVFQADLQLYRVAAATGDWATLKTQAINVGLSYSGASVAPSNSNQKRDEGMLSWPPIKREEPARTRTRRAAAAAPSLVQEMMFVGKVSADKMGQINQTANAKNILIPNIALSGTDKAGKVLTAELSSSDASFVNGIFANEVKTTTSAGTSASSAAAQAAKFVLPGTHLGIFPVGLIVTSSWTLLFLATVGYGTMERLRFREAYRRRVKYRQAMGIRR